MYYILTHLSFTGVCNLARALHLWKALMINAIFLLNKTKSQKIRFLKIKDNVID